MPFIRCLIWVFLACLPSIAMAEAVSPLALRNVCSNAFFSQSDVTACLEKVSADSLQALQLAEKKLAQALSEWDEDPRYIQQAHLHAVASKTAFALYRTQHCKLLSAISGGAAGNSYQMRHLACTSVLNQRRAAQLLEIAAELPAKPQKH